MATPEQMENEPWRIGNKEICPRAEPTHTGSCKGKGAEHHGLFVDPSDGLMYGSTCPCCETPVTCPVCRGKRGRTVEFAKSKQKGRKPPGTVDWPECIEDNEDWCNSECARCFDDDDNVGLCGLPKGHRGRHHCNCCGRKWVDDLMSVFAAVVRAEEEEEEEDRNAREARAMSAALTIVRAEEEEEFRRDLAALRDLRPQAKARPSTTPPPIEVEPSLEEEPEQDECPDWRPRPHPDRLLLEAAAAVAETQRLMDEQQERLCLLVSFALMQRRVDWPASLWTHLGSFLHEDGWEAYCFQSYDTGGLVHFRWL